MNQAIETISQTLASDLGAQLEAVFLFGSHAAGSYQTAVSDINLLLIAAPEASIHAIRDSFQPLWQSHHTLLKRAPLIATQHALQRHLQFNPSLALHLLQHGKQIAGLPMPANLFRSSVNPYEVYARLSQQLLDASVALSQADKSPTDEQLNRLARQISHKPVAQAETAASQFSTINKALTAVIAQLPITKAWHETAQSGPTSPNIPGLQAIYTENDKNIFVFDQLPLERIRQINWQQLAQHLPQANGSLHITTVAQFCLMTLYEKALDLRFNKYDHKWGLHFLARLTPSAHQILRHAARFPSHILLDALPNTYLTSASGNQELHKIIHDVQNRMLNIQLENELLFRLGLVPEKFTPPEPLPEPDASSKERLTAIFQQLEWWTDFYQTALQANP
jgi:hypothetical protein